MHLLIGVIRRRVLDQCDLVAELNGKANGRFDAGMCDESDDDELMDAEATISPMVAYARQMRRKKPTEAIDLVTLPAKTRTVQRLPLRRREADSQSPGILLRLRRVLGSGYWERAAVDQPAKRDL